MLILINSQAVANGSDHTLPDPTQEAPATHGLALFDDPKYGPGFQHLTYANPAAPKGGTLRQAATGAFDNLHPFLITGQAAARLNLTYDTLMRRVWDEPFSVYALIAESVVLSPDRRRMEFRLNPAARFHDGHPVTAEDVRFSLEALRTHGRPNTRRTYGLVDKIETPDDHSVIFHLDPAAERELPLVLAMLPVLPAHYWADKEFGDTTLTPPLGGGPYRIASIDPGRQIIYQRVDDYWGADLPVNRGHYNFDRVQIEYFRDNDVALEAFKAGETDFRREGDPTAWATRYDVPGSAGQALNLEELAHQRPDWARALIMNTRRTPLDDLRVRQALDLAFDFEWLNRAVFRGAYKRIESYFPNSELAATGTPTAGEATLLEPFADTLPAAVFNDAYSAPQTDGSGMAGRRGNLRHAIALLREAGWQLKGGKLVDADGEQMQLEILIQTGAEEGIVLEWTRTLARLGIKAGIRSVDATQFRQRLNAFDYDVVLYRWINTLSPGLEQRLYWGSEFADQQGSRNYAGVRSEAVDALAAGIANAESREDLITHAHALDRVLTHNHYAVLLYHLGHDLVAYWDPVQRPENTPLYGLVIEAWWADQVTQ